MIKLNSNEFACAAAVNNVCESAFGEPVGGGASTYLMYHVLKNHVRFIEVLKPEPGDIILSPTGTGGGLNGIKNGHVGIVSEGGKIMSNSSKTGRWEENYTLYSWGYRYSTLGGYMVKYYRRVW